MAIVKLGAGSEHIEIRGQLGRPTGVGEHWLGWSVLGEENPTAGVYQRRPRAKGQIIVRMRHYVTPNPRTVAQQAWRMYFSVIMGIWLALPDMEREAWNDRQSKPGKSGMNCFISAYAKRRPTDCGATICGSNELGYLTQ